MQTNLTNSKAAGDQIRRDRSPLRDLRRRGELLLDHPAARLFIERLLLLVIVFVGAWVLYFAVTTVRMPYPLEFREGASTVMTQFLLEGRNPYALENQPLGTYHYGIVYSVLVLPLAALFGNGLLVHRIVTCVFIILSAVLVAWTIFRSNRTAVIAAACGLLVAMALATRGALGAFPGSVGTLLFLAILIAPFRRSFDWPSLLCSTVLSLIAFYTKPYFVLALGLVIAYTLLFVSKRRAVVHALLSAAAFLISFLVVRRMLPMYFVYVLVTSYLDSGPSTSHMLLQLTRLRQEFYPVMALGLLVLVAAAWRSRSHIADGLARIFHIDFRHPGLPLLEAKMDYFGFAAVGSTLVFLLILGPHTGQFMTYAYQLMVPPFLIWLGLRLQPEGRLLWIIVPVLVLNLVGFGTVRLNPATLEWDRSGDWARLYRLIDRSSHILNSPVLTAEMIRQGKWPADSGQSEYYFILTRGYAALGTLLGPDYEDIRGQGRLTLEAIRTSVSRGDYDLIALPVRYEIDVEEAMRGRYIQTAKLRVDMPQTQEHWSVSIWTLPINK